jgi:hypothetical protein
VDELQSHRFGVSVARSGDHSDNTMMGSLFKTLKYEGVDLYEH